LSVDVRVQVQIHEEGGDPLVGPIRGQRAPGQIHPVPPPSLGDQVSEAPITSGPSSAGLRGNLDSPGADHTVGWVSNVRWKEQPWPESGASQAFVRELIQGLHSGGPPHGLLNKAGIDADWAQRAAQAAYCAAARPLEVAEAVWVLRQRCPHHLRYPNHEEAFLYHYLYGGVKMRAFGPTLCGRARQCALFAICMLRTL
ncbi:hypothetical protein HPB47_020817, partial [Ixodes persulcatus]